MKEHLENMSKFEDNLKKEQARTKEALRQKLEERRRKRKQSEGAKSQEALSGEESFSATGTPQKIAALQDSSRAISQTPVKSATAPFPQRMDSGGGFCNILHLNCLYVQILSPD